MNDQGDAHVVREKTALPDGYYKVDNRYQSGQNYQSLIDQSEAVRDVRAIQGLIRQLSYTSPKSTFQSVHHAILHSKFFSVASRTFQFAAVTAMDLK